MTFPSQGTFSASPQAAHRQCSQDILDQDRRDAEYLSACRDAGIEPLVPRYDSKKPDYEACIDREPDQRHDRKLNPNFVYFDDETDDGQIPAEYRRGFLAAISLLGVEANGAAQFVGLAGLRVMCLSWMLGRGEFSGRSLSSIAEEIGLSRAALSWHVRTLERATGLHGRAQKSTRAPEASRRARIRQIAEKKQENEHCPT